MRSEKLFWGGLLCISLACIAMFGYFFLLVIFPFHVEQMKKRAGETTRHLQMVLPHLRPEARQAYLEGLARKNEDLRYPLLMDLQGSALTTSVSRALRQRTADDAFNARREPGEGPAVPGSDA